MTRDDFLCKYRRDLLGFMAESWAVRKLSPTEFGQVMDGHLIAVRKLLNAIYDDLVPAPKAPVNGAPETSLRKDGR